MTKIQHKRSSVLVSGAAKAPTASQLDYGELAINYSSTDPQLFIKDSSGSVISILSSYAPLAGADFTGNVSFDANVVIKGDSTNGSGELTLNCEINNHAVKIKGPAHSASANYPLTLPTSAGSSSQVLTTDGSGNLSWAVSSMSTADKTKLDGIETGATADQTGAEIKSLYEAEADTNAFTDSLLNKLINIASGAEVNVNADWNATSGDAQILNKPTVVSAFTNDAGYITSADGGNAQTLDGLDSTQFLRSDANDTLGGVLSYTSDAARLQFTNTTYSAQLHIGGWTTTNSNDISRIRNSTGNLHIDSAANGSLYLNHYSTGDVFIRGNTAWHAGNDGSGSGLDADNLDGYTWNSSGKDVRATEFYADNWFRNYNDGEGLYNQATGVHWHSDGDGYWTARDSSSHIGIKLKTNGSSLRGYVYANSSNEIGFLDSDGNWAIRHVRDSRTEFFINNTEYAEINTDYLTHTSDIRSPLFYDSNNTSYYLDPASYSYVAYLGRRAHHTGHLVGSYNSVGPNSYKSNPIYTIGSSYNPADAALSNMYGIGYTHTNASFFSLSGQSGWGMYVASDGDARVQLNGGNGAISCTGNITAYASDQRLKTNIKPIDNALNKLMKISGVEYDWIDECESEYEFQPRQKHEIGVIAQEVQKVLPELVFEAPFNSLYKAKTGWQQIQKRLQQEEDQAASVEDREAIEITKAIAKEEFEKLPLDERVSMCTDHQFLTVDYERLAPVLIEAIKEISVRLTALENK